MDVPIGAWILALSLSDETTQESLQAFLADRGVDLPLENISIKQNPKGTSALVSINNEVAAVLVDWALNGAPLHGKPVLFRPWISPPREQRRY